MNAPASISPVHRPGTRRDRLIPLGAALAAATLLAAAACAPPGGPEPVREGYVMADDGARLFYRIVGEGAQTVVVPVGFYLEEALAPLAAEGRRLVFYDPRGRGRSERVDTSRISLDHQVADVEAVRQALGIERMALIGWSGLGMEMAVYAFRHPGRVTRLVQVAPVPPRAIPWAARGYAARGERFDRDRLQRLEERSAEGEFDHDPAGYCRAIQEITLPALLADPANAARVPDPCRYENEWPIHTGPLFEALLGSFGEWDWREELEASSVPRLVVHGAEEAFPLEGSREWVAGHPNARLLVVPGARHFPFVDRPDVFFPAVDRFLDGEWPEGAEPIG